MSCTFVTALFDLGTAERNTKRRSATTYLKLFERLASISHPLVIFIESRFLDKVNQIISKYSSKDIPRKVIIKEITELACYPYLEQMTMLSFLGNPVSNRDTCLSSVMTNSKTSLVAEVAEANPFSTKHFAWIDIGIHHLQYISYPQINEIVMNIPDKVKIPVLCATHPNEIKDRSSYYSMNRGKVAGTIFTGGRNEMITFHKMFMEEFKVMLNSGRVCLEEQIMGALAGRNPDFFEYYFCDYTSVLSNYVNIHNDRDTILRNLEYCRSSGLHQIGVRIGKDLMKSLQLGLIKFEQGHMAQLLYDLYICSYYVSKETAIHIGEIIIMLNQYNASMSVNLGKYSNLNENLKFSGLDLSKLPYTWETFLDSDAYSFCYTIL